MNYPFRLLTINAKVSDTEILIAGDYYDPHDKVTISGDKSSSSNELVTIKPGTPLWADNDEPGQTSVSLCDLPSLNDTDGGLRVTIACESNDWTAGKSACLKVWHATDQTDNEPIMSSNLEVLKPGETIFRFPMSGHLCGLRGPFKFAVRIQGYEKDMELQEQPDFEVYWLHSNRLPKFFDDGVDLLLLRMFLLPLTANARADATPTFTTEQWIELVVRIIHGTKEPLTGRDKNIADHWLQYDSHDGYARFAGSQGGDFKLEAWLDAYRNWTGPKKIKTEINCYDQAGATEVALSLGLRYQQIAWEYHQLFGFLDSDCTLVGWGKCNNPYFEKDPNRMVLNKDNPKRWPFRNHALLSWCPDADIDESFYKNNNERVKLLEMNKKKLDKEAIHEDYVELALQFEDEFGKQLFMIDSCAGPHIGTERRDAYWSGVGIIHKPFGDSKNEHVRDYAARKVKRPNDVNEQHYLGHGVNDFDADVGKIKLDRFSSSLQVEVTEIESLWKKTELDEALENQNLSQAFMNSVNALGKEHPVWKMSQNSAVEGVVIGSYVQLAAAFEAAVAFLHSDWRNLSIVPVRDYHIGSTTIKERRLQYTAPDQTQRTCSLKVMLSKTPALALDQFTSTLATHALLSLDHPIRKIVPKGNQLGDIKTLGAGSLRAFLYRNLAVFISGPELWAKLRDETVVLILSRVVAKMPYSSNEDDWQKFWEEPFGDKLQPTTLSEVINTIQKAG